MNEITRERLTALVERWKASANRQWLASTTSDGWEAASFRADSTRSRMCATALEEVLASAPTQTCETCFSAYGTHKQYCQFGVTYQHRNPQTFSCSLWRPAPGDGGAK